MTAHDTMRDRIAETIRVTIGGQRDDDYTPEANAVLAVLAHALPADVIEAGARGSYEAPDPEFFKWDEAEPSLRELWTSEIRAALAAMFGSGQ